MKLIEEGVLHPDGHDRHENTLLTEAVKRKDAEGVRFALTKAHCSIDLSCDCPLHNTALHYWAQGAGSHGGKDKEAEQQIFKLLMEHHATINIINSAGQTPLDMASNKSAIQMLQEKNAVRHVTRDGAAGLLTKFKGSLFGYSANQRMLLANQENEQLSSPRLPKEQKEMPLSSPTMQKRN